MTVEEHVAYTPEVQRQLAQWDRDYLIHPQWVPAPGAKRIILVEGSGVHVRDVEGNEYLDATGGLWCAQVGHGRTELAEAARDQMERLEYFSSFWELSNEPSIRLAQKVVELAPEGLDAVYFTTGGSESNEIAFMLARMFHARNGEPKRTIILSRHSAYHGVTYGARAATGMEDYHGSEEGALPSGFHHLLAPYPYRLDNCTDVCVAELETTIEQLGPENIAAMIGEPVMGVGGMVVPPDDYWPRIQAVLRKYGILLILDEVVTGYGRTGAWFAAPRFGLNPDILVFAKGITSGYQPLGGTIVRGDIRDAALEAPGFHTGFTYSCHPTLCAVALRNLQIVEEEGLLDNATTQGAYLLEKFQELREFPVVGDVRGCGMMLAIELVEDRKTKAPAVDLSMQLGPKFMSEMGVIVRSVWQNLVVSPPLIFSREDCDEVVHAVRTLLETYGNSGA